MAGSVIRSTWHTGLTVSDLDRSIAFFRDMLGCTIEEPIRPVPTVIESLTGVAAPDLTIVFVHAPDHAIELLHFGGVKGRAPSKAQPSDYGFCHLAFIVNDLDAVLAEARQFGVEPIRPPLRIEAGRRKGWRICYTRDPDGIVFEFAQEPKAATS